MRLTRALVPVTALLLSGLSAYALAQDGGGGPPDSPPGTTAAVCGGPPPCTAVNSLADPTTGGEDGEVMQFEEALATRGRPASACPTAAAAYEAAGLHVDAFIGPCPDPNEAERFRPSPFAPGDVMVERGGK